MNAIGMASEPQLSVEIDDQEWPKTVVVRYDKLNLFSKFVCVAGLGLVAWLGVWVGIRGIWEFSIGLWIATFLFVLVEAHQRHRFQLKLIVFEEFAIVRTKRWKRKSWSVIRSRVSAIHFERRPYSAFGFVGDDIHILSINSFKAKQQVADFMAEVWDLEVVHDDVHSLVTTIRRVGDLYR